MTGHRRRMNRLIPPGRPALWLPIDDGLIAGPENHLRDVRTLLRPAVTDHLDAVIGFWGSLTAAVDQLHGTATIMNLTASTSLGEHLNKVRVATVTDAVRAGADAVAVHLNLSSPHEPGQLTLLGDVVSEAAPLGMPVVAFAYLRGANPDLNYTALRRDDPAAYAMMARHCVRIVVELGASIVKTIHPGSHSAMQALVESAMGIPVVIAGEQLSDETMAINKAVAAVAAGAAGVAYGRQIFHRDDPAAFVARLRGYL